VIGRLRDGVDRQTAQADVDRVAALLAEQHPQSLGRVGVTLTPLKETVVGQTRPLLLALLAAVVLVLLIACANIANLLLARAAGRQREIALRGTLGAGHGRLARQLLTESLLLAVMGGTAGILLGGWGLDVLRWLAPAGTPRLEEVRLDGGVLLFGLAASLATGVLFGLAPALGLSRPRLAAALREGGRSGMAPGRSRLRATLVVTELALGLALLIAAGLLIRSLGALSHVDPGFRADHVAVGQVAFPASRFPDPGQAFAVFDQFIERLGAQPQARAVGAVTVLPLSGNQLDLSIGIEGRLPPPGEEQAADFRAATPGYFRTMEIPLKAGRLPDGGDGTQAPKVVVVSERFAERFFPGEDPVGKRLRIGNVQNPEAPWWTVVGVVGGVRDNQLDKLPDPEVYAPFAQRPSRSVNLVMRYEGATDSALRALREAVAAVDPSRPVARLGTMEELVARSLAPARFVTFLLAAVGIYGVVAYSVGQRSREIGIRLAIGAERVSILGMVLRWGMRLLVPGLLLGLAAAFFLVRLLASLLSGVQPADPATFASVSVLLALVTLAACYLPARRAARLDPVRTLKAE
jgi:putative ABC transport system permease protein